MNCASAGVIPAYTIDSIVDYCDERDFYATVCVDRAFGAVCESRKQRLFGRLGAIRFPMLRAQQQFSPRACSVAAYKRHLGFEGQTAPRLYAAALSFDDFVFHLEFRRCASGESAFVSLFVGEVALPADATEQSYSLVCPAPSSLAQYFANGADENADAMFVRVVGTKRATGESALLYSSNELRDGCYFQLDDIPLARTQLADLVHPMWAEFGMRPSMSVDFDREEGAFVVDFCMSHLGDTIDMPLSSAITVLEHFVEFA